MRNSAEARAVVPNVSYYLFILKLSFYVLFFPFVHAFFLLFCMQSLFVGLHLFGLVFLGFNQLSFLSFLILEGEEGGGLELSIYFGFLSAKYWLKEGGGLSFFFSIFCQSNDNLNLEWMNKRAFPWASGFWNFNFFIFFSPYFSDLCFCVYLYCFLVPFDSKAIWLSFRLSSLARGRSLKSLMVSFKGDELQSATA